MNSSTVENNFSTIESLMIRFEKQNNALREMTDQLLNVRCKIEAPLSTAEAINAPIPKPQFGPGLLSAMDNQLIMMEDRLGTLRSTIVFLNESI